MPSYLQQMIVFHRRVRAGYEEALDKTKKKLEFIKKELKSEGLDEARKESLEATNWLLESEIKSLKELIALTHRKK